jgi:repressor LexA
MERMGKNQKELAEIVGVSAPTMNDWLKAKKYPRIDKIEILANYFGILKSDLIEDKKEESTEYDGLSENMRELIKQLKDLPEDKIQMLLQVAKSIK